MRPSLLAVLVLNACVRTGASPEEESCSPIQDRSVLDRGRDMIMDAEPPIDCSPLTALRCGADEAGCEGVFRCASIDLDFRQGPLPAGVTLSRSSPAYHVNAAGALVLAPADAPRFDHSPSTGRSLGLLVEGQQKNFIPWSSALDRWTPESVKVSDTGHLSPAGDRALTLEATGGAVPHRLHLAQIPSFTYTWLSLSSFVKPLRTDHGFEIVLEALKNIITVSFDLQSRNQRVNSGSLHFSSRIESYPGGWLRVVFAGYWPGGAVTGPVTLSIGIAAPGSLDFVVGDGKPSFAVWGLQLERGSFATSPIPTSGSPAVRAPDVVRYLANQPVPVTGGTLLLEAIYPYLAKYDDRNAVVLAATGPAGDALSLRAARQLELLASGPQGSLQLGAGPNRFGVGRPHRAVVRCDGTRWGLFEDGARAAEADEDLGPVAPRSFRFGSGQGLDPFFGHLRRLTCWSAPLAAATVEVLAR